jgi:hypothetical protein
VFGVEYGILVLDATSVEIIELGRLAHLSCSVNNVAVVINPAVVDTLIEGTLDRRVIRFNEMTLDKLYNQR